MKLNKLFLLIAAVVDFLFFFLLTQLHARVFVSIAEHLKAAMEMLAKGVGELAIADMQQAAVFADPAFLVHYHEVLKGIAVFLAGFYVLWIVVRGTAWLLAHKAAGSKIRFSQFVVRFFIISTAGMILFLVVMLLFVSLLNYVTFSVLPLINPRIANGITLLLVLLLHYCYCITIAGIGSKHPYKTPLLAFKQAKTLVPYLGSVLWYIIAVTGAVMLSRLNFWGGLLFAAVIIMPSITFFRTVLIDSFIKAVKR